MFRIVKIFTDQGFHINMRPGISPNEIVLTMSKRIGQTERFQRHQSTVSLDVIEYLNPETEQMYIKEIADEIMKEIYKAS